MLQVLATLLFGPSLCLADFILYCDVSRFLRLLLFIKYVAIEHETYFIYLSCLSWDRLRYKYCQTVVQN